VSNGTCFTLDLTDLPHSGVWCTVRSGMGPGLKRQRKFAHHASTIAYSVVLQPQTAWPRRFISSSSSLLFSLNLNRFVARSLRFGHRAFRCDQLQAGYRFQIREEDSSVLGVARSVNASSDWKFRRAGKHALETGHTEPQVLDGTVTLPTRCSTGAPQLSIRFQIGTSMAQ